MTSSTLSTQVVQAGEKRTKPYHAIATPIFQTSTYTFENTRDLINFYEASLAGENIEREEYGRYGNPTTAAVEAKLASLDGGKTARLFSSGMAAVTTTLLSLLSTGDHLIITDDGYRRTRQFVTQFLERFGIESSVVQVGDYEALLAAIRPTTQVILTESPTNPHLRVVDLPKLVTIARDRGIRTIVDSTFATPINQRPLEFGVDLVVHSASKYLGGHNDLLAGVVVGPKSLLKTIKESQGVMGDVVAPHTAYLLLRGLKTLDVRVRRQNESGQQIAQFLAQHPAVRHVYYPGLPDHPDHTIATEQMSGFGGVVTFELDTNFQGTSEFIDRLRIPYISPSLGGTESLVEQVAIIGYYDLSPEERADLGIGDSLVRLAIGLEAADDLIADLAQALDQTFHTK